MNYYINNRSHINANVNLRDDLTLQCTLHKKANNQMFIMYVHSRSIMKQQISCQFTFVFFLTSFYSRSVF